jgi:hypothetical protein
VARGAERQGMRDTAERMSRDLEGLGGVPANDADAIIRRFRARRTRLGMV